MTEQEIFEQALDKPAEERAAFLEAACGCDAALGKRLEALLRSHEEAEGFLDVPAVVQLAGPASGSTAGAADLSFLTPSSKPDSLGRLDHYEILEVVGHGGMGVVLRANDSKLQRVVAIKVLAAPLAASGSARQRFVREARAAAAVRDDHVIGIHAVEDHGLVPYIVMEFIDGCTLEALIRRGGPLQVKDVLRIGMQVALGLAAAHNQGLIHRDVKPANILLENSVQRVKLTDFGLARAGDDASLSQRGLIAGTPLYMSPEQAAGEPLDSRADLFSLGSVLYEMCTGQPAFPAPTTLSVIKRVSEEEPRPIREVNSEIPEGLCRLIERLHAKNPADRFTSAHEVAELLTGFLSGQVSMGPSPKAHWNSASKNWAYAATALVLALTGLGVSEATGVTDVRGTVIRLFSPEGTLVVEVGDPGVSVTVDGADLIITGAGAKEIRLKPGQYKVEASKDGTLVRRELVTVARNGRQVVRISKESVEHVLNVLDPWEKSVAVLPAEEQVKAVERRLHELNPEFRGKIESGIRDDKVIWLSFLTDQITDISPVRALKDLKSLSCGGSAPRQGRLSDLTPLRGLPIDTLACADSLVTNLEPLRGMPLIILHCQMTGVSSLAPLEGKKLVMLSIQGTPVTDLKPLRGMPLKALDMAWVRGVTELKPLEGLPLTYLNISEMLTSDLSTVASLKSLEWLVLDNLPVTDLSPVRGLPLTQLSFRGTRVTDLTVLSGLPLEHVRLDYRPEDEKILRSLPGLTVINDKPEAQFWKEVKGN
jgi:serine/threonine protein kinase/Leucine-rich repeat (LRR) protein